MLIQHHSVSQGTLKVTMMSHPEQPAVTIISI